MQVALATLWSCFPVSASGADMLLFSLLHTSSGSCCSAETNHGLLRSSHNPLLFLSLSLSLCVLFCFFFPKSPLSLFFFLTILFLRFPQPPSLFLSLALLPFGHAKAALSQHGHRGCPEEAERPGSQRSSPPGRYKQETGTSSSLLLLLLICSVSLLILFPPKKRCSQSSPPTLKLYLLYLFNCLCLVFGVGVVGFSLVSLATGPQCGLQMRRKLYCFCYVVIQARLF